MDDLDPITADASPVEPQRRVPSAPLHLHVGMAVLSRALCLSVAMASLFFLIRLFTIKQEVHVYWSLQVSLGISALFSSVFVAVHQWHHWATPLQRLRELLPRVRAGELPIDELQCVGGGLAPLVAEIQETLRDTRRQRAQVARVEHEMRQRMKQASQAAERRLGSLKAQAARDALTGLYNRRMLDEYFPQILRESQEQGTPLCVMMIDIDYFKQLNDSMGHAAGDTLLKSIGQLIRSTIRDADWAFRYGGDEFALVLPGCARASGEILGRRLASLIDGLVKPMRLSAPPRLSFGLATLDEVSTDSDVTTLLKCADQELYRLKMDRKTRDRLNGRAVQDSRDQAA